MGFQLARYRALPQGPEQALLRSYQALILAQDGALLHCSPLSHQCPAPPLSTFQLRCPATPLAVCPLALPHHLATLLPDGSVQLWHFLLDGGKPVAAAVPSPERPCSFVWDLRHSVEQDGKVVLLEWREGLGAGSFKCRFSLDSQLQWTGTTWPAGDEASKADDFESLPPSGLSPGEVKRLQLSGETGPSGWLSLTEGSELRWNEEVIAENCTSFAVSQQFLLFTSMTQGMFDMLHIYPLQDLPRVSSLMARLPKSSTGKDHHLRNVERGSEIVCLADQRLVFELPRGNLEVIYPKLLLFHEMKRLILTEKNFLLAYKEVRRHKLDMNLLTDVCQATFEEEVRNGRFLQRFRRVDDINLILNSLDAEVCGDLQYIYSPEALGELRQRMEQAYRGHGGSKVNYVCSLLREAMEKERDHFILSIVMTYTRQQPPQLAAALELVRELQRDEDELCDVFVAPHLNPASKLPSAAMQRDRLKKHKLSSKEVLEYLSWVTDPVFLYDVALSTFDLKLAVMVAETTQKDPKEYLPYIDALRAISDEIDRRVKICLDTKRFELAIKLLAEGSEEHVSRAIQIIRDKKLFHQGLACFAKKPAVLRTVRGLFADDLVVRSDFKQAAPFYLANQDTDKALDCYSVDSPHRENTRLRSRLRPPRVAGRPCEDRRLPAGHEDRVRAAQAADNCSEDHDEDVQVRQTRVRLAAHRTR